MLCLLLPALLALMIVNGQVIMFWTTAWKDRFLLRHEAVLSSYTRHGYNVTVYAVVTDEDERFVEISKRHQKVRFERMTDDFMNSLSDCPHSDWLLEQRHKTSPHYYSHLTDYLRFCLLFKYGGIYSDFDALLLRRLPEAPKNKLVVGKDEIGEKEQCEWCLGGGRHYAAPGVMMAANSGLSILKRAIDFGFADYDGSSFGSCGPRALTRAVKQVRSEAHLLPTFSFYPVNWSNAWRLFQSDSGTLWTSIVNNKQVYSIHFYGSATRSLEIEMGSIMDKFVDKSVIIMKPYWDYTKESLYDCLQILRAERVEFLVRHGSISHDYLSYLNGMHNLNSALKNIQYDAKNCTTDILTVKIWNGGAHDGTVNLAIFDLEKSVTVVTKTFGRMSKVLSLVDSLYEVYPNNKLRILVGDDGYEAVQQSFNSTRFDYVPFEYDIGLSEGRNCLLNLVRTEYALFLDDDFILTKESDIGVLLATSILDNVDIVGGKSPSDVSEFQFDYSGLMRFDEQNGRLYLSPGHYSQTTTGCQMVDFVPNLFVAKTESLKKVRWDPILKLGEHEDFFWRSKQQGLTVATCSSVSFRHMQSRFWENKTMYDKMRLRVFDFLKLALQKHQWQSLVTMGRTVMQLMDISNNPIQRISVESVSPNELRTFIFADKPYRRFRLHVESNDMSRVEEFYNLHSVYIPDLEADSEHVLSIYAGNYTEWSLTPATIRVKTPSLKDNLLVDGNFDSKWTCWKGSIGTTFNFEPTITWKQPGILWGRSTGYAIGMSVLQNQLLPEYSYSGQFYHSFYQKVDFTESNTNCANGGKLIFSGWSRPDRFSHADTIRGYRLQLEVQFKDNRKLEAVSVDFDHQKNEWHSRVASAVLSGDDQIRTVTVRAVLDAMRAGAFFDDFYLGLWCR